MRHVCFATCGAEANQMIELQQTGFDKFTVVYGMQVKSGLTYAKAASELGACIMHMQACNGELDNRTQSEALESGDSFPCFGE